MDIGVILGMLIYALILIIPTARILQRTGYSPWLSVLAIVPIVNLIALWVFAFARWPLRSHGPY